MKKVGKEFRKSLSAILAAAMVVSSMPETSLVANAEEVDAQEQSYELDDSIVDNGESASFDYELEKGDVDEHLEVEYRFAEGTDNTEKTLPETLNVNAKNDIRIKVTPDDNYEVGDVYVIVSDEVIDLNPVEGEPNVYSIPDQIAKGDTAYLYATAEHIKVETVTASLSYTPTSANTDLTFYSVDKDGKETKITGAVIPVDSTNKQIKFKVEEAESATYEVKNVTVSGINSGNSDTAISEVKLTAVKGNDGIYTVDLTDLYDANYTDTSIPITVTVTDVLKAAGEAVKDDIDASEPKLVGNDDRTAQELIDYKDELVLDDTASVIYTSEVKDEGNEAVGKTVIKAALDEAEGKYGASYEIKKVVVTPVAVGSKTPEIKKAVDGKNETFTGKTFEGDALDALGTTGVEIPGTLYNVEELKVEVYVARKADVIKVTVDKDSVDTAMIDSVKVLYAATVPAGSSAVTNEVVNSAGTLTVKPYFVNKSSVDTESAKGVLYVAPDFKSGYQLSKINGSTPVEAKDSNGDVIEDVYTVAVTGDVALTVTAVGNGQTVTVTNTENRTVAFKEISAAEATAITTEQKADDAFASLGTTKTPESGTFTVENGKALLIRVANTDEVHVDLSKQTKVGSGDTNTSYDYYIISLITTAKAVEIKSAKKTVTFGSPSITQSGYEVEWKYSSEADTAYKTVKDDTTDLFTTGISVNKDSKITFRVRLPKHVAKQNVFTYNTGVTGAKDVELRGKLDNSNEDDVLTFEIDTKDVTSFTKFVGTEVCYYTIKESDENADYKVSTDMASQDTSVTAAGVLVPSDKDVYIAVNWKTASQKVKTLTLTGGTDSLTATLVADNLFKIAKTTLTEDNQVFSLTATADEVKKTIAVTNDKENKHVNLYYGGSSYDPLAYDGDPLAQSWTKVDATVDLTDTEITARTIKFLAVSTDKDKYMLSYSNVNKAENNTYYEAGKAYEIIDVKVDGTVESPSIVVASEALAYDYCFKSKEDVEVFVEGDNVTKYTPADKNRTEYVVPTEEIGSGDVIDGADLKDGKVVVVRVLNGKEVKFTAKALADGKEISAVKVNGSETGVTKYAESYTFKSGDVDGDQLVDNKVNVTFETDAIQPRDITFNITDADAMLENVEVFIDNTTHKATEEATKTQKITNTGTNVVDVMPGQDVRFKIKTKDPNYTGKVAYKVNGETVIEEGVTDHTFSNVTDDQTIYVSTILDESRFNVATLDLGDATIGTDAFIDVKGLGKYDADAKTITRVPGTTSNNKLTLKATPKTGYSIKSITVGGEELTLEDLTKVGTEGYQFEVDFGTEEITENSVKKTVAKAGQNIAVKVVTEAKTAETDKRFMFALDDGIEVSVSETSGVTSYDSSKYGKKVYTVDAETSSEVEFTAKVKNNYKVNNLTGANIVSEVGKTSDSEYNYFTFKINVFNLTNALKADKTPNVPDIISLEATEGLANIKITSEVGEAILYKGNSDNDMDYIKSGTGFNRSGLSYGNYVIEYSKYGTLKVKGKDTKDETGATKEVWTDVPDVESYTDNDGYTVNRAYITLTEDAEYKIVNEKLGAYQVTANGSTIAGISGDNEETGLLSEYTVKAGDSVKIKVNNNDITSANWNLAGIKLSDNTTASVNPTNKNEIDISVSAKDAGKTFTFDIVNKEYDATSKVSKDVTVVSGFKLIVAPATATVTAKAGDKELENGATLQVTAGTKTELDMSYSSDIVTGLLEVTNTGSALGADFFKEYPFSDYDYKKLVIDATALKAGATSTVSIKYDTKTIMTFKVEAVAPSLKITNVSVPATGSTYVNLTATPDKIVVPENYANTYYYEVKVTPTGTTQATKAVNGYYYFEASKSAIYETEVEPLANKITVNGAKTEKDTYAGTYDISVRLVLSTDSTLEKTTAVPSASNTIIAGSEVTTVSTSTSAPKFETNLTAKQINKTVYTGQYAELANIMYSDSASYVSDVSYEFLNKDGSVANGLTGTASCASGVLAVDIPNNMQPGTYTVNVYSENQEQKNNVGTDSIYQSKATFKVKVEAGINNITANVPNSLYLKGNKNVTFQVKPVGYSWAKDKKNEYIKAKSQKFTYEIENNQMNAAAKANIDANVSISNKGKITISKNFEVMAKDAYNQFTVVVKPADFEGNDTVPYRHTVTVTKEAAEIASITLVDNNDKNLGTSVDLSQIGIFNTSTNNVVQNSNVKVLIKDVNGNVLDPNSVTLTPTSGNVFIKGQSLYRKPGKTAKKITVKAVAKDGGKKSLKATFELGYKTDGNLNGVVDANGTQVETSANNWTITNAGGKFSLYMCDGNPSDYKYARADVYNYSVSVKGGKILNTDKSDYYTTILPTSKDVVITVKNNNLKKDNKTVINVTDTSFPSAKAPKAKLDKGDKLYADLTEYQELHYTVNSADYNAVRVTQVSSSKDVFANRINGFSYPNIDIVLIDEDSRFTLGYNATSAKTGSVNYQLTYGTWDADKRIFTAATKPAKLTVNVSKNKAMKIDSAYTINYANDYKTEVTSDLGYSFGVVELQNKNVDGKSNNFTTIFKTEGNSIALNIDALKASGMIKKIDDIEKLSADDLSGYVKVAYATNSSYKEVVFPVTVTLSKEAVPYSFEADTVIANSTVYTYARVKNGDDYVEFTDGNTNAAAVTSKWSISQNDGKKVQLRTTAASTAGAYEVEFKILPDNSYYALFAKNIGKLTDNNVKTYGVSVKGTVNVLASGESAILTADKAVGFNLAADTTVQNYSGTGKTSYGTYTAYVALKDLFPEQVDKTGTITTLGNDEMITAVKTDSKQVKKVELTTDAKGNKAVAITVTSENLDITAVDVTFTSTHKATQVVTIPVASTKQYTVSEVGALVADYVSGLVYGTDTNTNAKIRQLIVDDVTNAEKVAKASGITVSDVTLEDATDGTTTTATIKLVSIADSEATAEVSATLLANGTHVKSKLKDKTSAEIATDIDAHILSQDETVGGKKYADLGDKQVAYYEVTAETNRFGLRDAIKSYLEYEYSDAADYVINMPAANYEYTAAQYYENGRVKATVYILDKDGKTVSTIRINETFNMTRKPVEEETN